MGLFYIKKKKTMNKGKEEMRGLYEESLSFS
jgi:hypothetical protein